MNRTFITGTEFSPSQLKEIIERAISFKNSGKWPSLSGKILTLIFANPSLRTRLSFESGMKKLGGDVNVLDVGSAWQFEYQDGAVMDGANQEHIKEAARVISQYTDAIGLRASELMSRPKSAVADEATQLMSRHPAERGASQVGTTSFHQPGLGSSSWKELRLDLPIRQLARYATVPVINMESNMFHPCQGMADVMTLAEEFGGVASLRGKKYVLTWAPHPKALPLATPHSQMLMPASFGAHVTVVHPDGFDLDAQVVNLAQEKAKETGGSLTIAHSQKEAFAGADVVVAKSWASLKYFGDWEAEGAYRKKFADWTVTERKMTETNKAVFLHCLPVRRNVVVSDAVLDSEKSLIIKEAANRMWVQMAILAALMQP